MTADGRQDESLGDAAADVRQRVEAGAESLRETVRDSSKAATERLGARGEAVADAMRAAGESLRGREDWLADAADSLGRTVADLAGSVREKGLDGVRRDAERLAREHPVLFMTTAVTVGLALGRVLRSSPASAGDPYERQAQAPAAGGSYEAYRQPGGDGGIHGAE